MKTAALNKETAYQPIEKSDCVDDPFEPMEREIDPEIEAAWIAETKRRWAELRSGTVQAIPGEQVFAKIRKRFAR